MSSYRSGVGTPYRSAQKKKLSNGSDGIINDGPVHDFVTLIDETKPDQWQHRTQAFSSLVQSIPIEEDGHDPKEWYGSPKTLRHLSRPLTALLKDARSSVVKSVCESLTVLFEKVGGNGRLLLKELVPVILDVHGQTVNTIRVSVEEMTVYVLPLVPCRAGMPAMLERLKNSKSRTVRQACALYLGICVKSWTQPDYLTKEVLMQVGTSLIKALRDASPTVRQEAKRGLENMQHQYPEEYAALVNNPNGLIARDPRLRKLLQRPADEIGDDVSVSSRASAASTSRLYSRSSPSSFHQSRSSPFGKPPSPSHYNRFSQRNAVGHQYGQALTTRREANLPTTVVVGGTLGSTRRSNLGPPLRVSTARQSPVANDAAPASRPPISPPPVLHYDDADDPGPFAAGVEELKRKAKTRRSRRSSFLQEKWRLSSGNLISEGSTDTPNDKNVSMENNHGDTNGEAKPEAQLNAVASPTTPLVSPPKEQNWDVQPESKLHDVESPSTPLVSPQNGEAKPVKLNDLALPTTLVSPPQEEGFASPSTQDLPEHVAIAKQVLEAHQKHIDTIMETIRLEMDAMQDFEKLMVDKIPREEDVVTYFDCIGLCLDQRTASGRLLQRELNRISGIQEEHANGGL